MGFHYVRFPMDRFRAQHHGLAVAIGDDIPHRMMNYRLKQTLGRLDGPPASASFSGGRVVTQITEMFTSRCRMTPACSRIGAGNGLLM
jgi:hypothetical protein